MKKKAASCVVTVMVLFFSSGAFSQQATPLPSWLSDKGYWVAETHLKEPKQAIIRFYNNDHVLVGISSFSGSRLKIEKARVKMQLKTMLEASLLQWAKRRNERQEDSSVAVQP